MGRLLVIALALVVGASVSSTDEAVGYPAISSPKPLNGDASTDTADDLLPQIATNGAGSWMAVWQSSGATNGGLGPDSEILVSRSLNNGWTWSDAAPIDSNAGSEALDEYYPHVAGAEDVWVAVWTVVGLAGTDRDILFSRSADGGMTWSSPELLASDASSDIPDDDFPRIATDGEGAWVIVWNTRDDTVPGIAKAIRVAHSTDDGVSWASPQTLTDPGGLAQTPQLAVYDSTWVLVWDVLSGDHDIMAAQSDGGGATWSAPVFVNSNHAVDLEHDMLPTIASDGSGGWIASWRSMEDLNGAGNDWDVLASRSSDGTAWEPVQVLNSNAYGDSQSDQQPVLLFVNGRWLALWQSLDDLDGTIGNDWDILSSSSDDGGQTWGSAVPFNPNASLDSGHDYGIGAATDGNGSSIIVWQSTENLGGSIGVDSDVLFMNCSLLFQGSDADCDGFDSSAETLLTTDPQLACSFTEGGDPASETWPPDLIESDSINISDVLALKPVFGYAVPPVSARYDLVSGGGINISDVLALKPYFGLECGA